MSIPNSPQKVDRKDCSILVLGAGELGMAVLSSLAACISLRPEVSLSVLLRPENEDVHEDIGKLTAEILFAEPALEDKVIYIAGDTITYRNLADSIDRVLQRHVERVRWTVLDLKNRLAAEPDDALAKYRVVFAEGLGVAWPKSGTFNAQRKLPVVGLQEWMQEHLTPGRQWTASTEEESGCGTMAATLTSTAKNMAICYAHSFKANGDSGCCKR